MTTHKTLSLDGGSHLPQNSWFVGLQGPVCSPIISLLLVLICPDKPFPPDSLFLRRESHDPRESGHMGNLESECSSPFLTAPEVQMVPSVLTKKVRKVLDPEDCSNPSGFCNYVWCWLLTKLIVAIASQYIHTSNHYVARLKLIQRSMSTVSQ